MDSEPTYQTDHGAAYQGDSRTLLEELPEGSIDLCVTSPPFALQREKEYGNKTQSDYNDWFQEFTDRVYRVLKPTGSMVVDIGGSWISGSPTRSLYHFELLTDLAGTSGKWNLAQDFYWHNPAKLPTPAQWVTIERIRAKDSVNHVWWLSKEERPKADNRRVLQEYSDSQEKLMEAGDKKRERPSQHNLSGQFDSPEEDGSIPPNLLEIANTASNTHYLKACRELGVDSHPARFPKQLPEFFIRFLTEPGDTVLDIFTGSNTTGKVAETLGREWVAFEQEPEYIERSELRFLSMAEIRKSEGQQTLDVSEAGSDD